MTRRKSEDSEPVDLFAAMVEHSRKQSGNSQVLTGPEADGCIVGLPLEHLALRWLFQSTVLPLGRTTILTGKRMSCKSAFMYEMFGWHRKYGGGGALKETENKDSPTLRLSLLNYDQGAVSVEPCSTMNEYTSAVLHDIDDYKSFSEGTKSKPGPGRKLLMAMGVDSLTATNSEETEKNIRKSGVAERRFPVEANMLSTWLKCLAPKIYGWPISLIFTNHNKPVANQQTGHMDPHMPGGTGPEFNATYVIYCQFAGKFEKAEWEGRRIKFKTLKNSLGPDGREITAEMLWRQQFVEGHGTVQRTYWDWHKSSIEMLVERMNHKLKSIANRVKEVIDLKVASGKRVSSEALGIDKGSPVSFSKAGKILEERKDLHPAIHAVLGVQERAVYQPDVDFLDQIAEAQKLSVARCAELPPMPPLLETAEDVPEEEEGDEE